MNCLHKACSKLLIQDESETDSNFRKRLHCDRSCYRAKLRAASAATQAIIERGEVICARDGCNELLVRRKNEAANKFILRIYCGYVCPHNVKDEPVNNFNKLMGNMTVVAL